MQEEKGFLWDWAFFFFHDIMKGKGGLLKLCDIIKLCPSHAV